MFQKSTKQPIPTIPTIEFLQLEISGLHSAIKDLNTAYSYHLNAARNIEATLSTLKRKSQKLQIALLESTGGVQKIPNKSRELLKMFEKFTTTNDLVSEAAALKQISELPEDKKLALIQRLVSG